MIAQRQHKQHWLLEEDFSNSIEYVQKVTTISTAMRIFICILLLHVQLHSSISHAQSSDYLPARFGDSEEAFIKELNLIELSISGTLVIRCSSPVAVNGVLGEPLCFGTETDREIARIATRAITDAAENLIIQPAKINNKPVRVMYPFTVYFQAIDGDVRAQLINNHLFNASSYGFAYSSAQRILKTEVTNGCHTLISSLGWLFTIGSATISDTGKLLDWNIEFEGEADCVREVTNSIRRSEFIPALYKGDPVSSTYTELMVTRGVN